MEDCFRFVTIWCTAATIMSLPGAAQTPRVGRAGPSATLFEGARLIVDGRRAPLENAAFVVENGRIVQVGRKGSLKAPAGAATIDVSGKTVMPALVDAHIHLGYQKDLVFDAANFTHETLVDQLNRYAHAGIGVVLSLGTDIGDLAFRLRSEQESGQAGGALIRTAGRGFAAPNAGPAAATMKPSAYGVTTDEHARQYVRDEVARKVDVIKIWVDDRNGTVQKLSPALYRAIIDEAHKHATPVIAHVFYLDDARDLVAAGVDGFAHLVRDREMDDQLVAEIKARNVLVMLNLAITENGIHTQAPAWLDDPLLHEVAPAAQIERARASFARRTAAAAERSAATYRLMQRSLARLSRAGARIGFGTDDGAVVDHFYAYTVHRELQYMVDAGMTPAEAVTAATVTSADLLRLRDHGTLEPGKAADFVVLDANPLDDIANTKKIAGVYLRGQPVDRRALAAAWK